ncbi:MAG: dihydrofolate reductase, partial [[Eubacterium] siraeum]|nr:dihydrofolate reductase [[Eubacterium] siraeum]
MKLIVAVDSKWGIGKNNDLLFHLKADMRHFVEHTKGNTVIMGSNTLRSFPSGLPLKGRTNIVLNPDGTLSDAQQKGYVLAKSLDGLKMLLQTIDTTDAYVIGGAMMYHTMLPYCDEAIITKVDA